MMSCSESIPSKSGVAAEFRDAMRLHAAGVCVISCGRGEAVNGMVATAVNSFSMDPPSMLVCVNASASMATELAQGKVFAVAILGRHHEALVGAFSRKPSGRARYDNGTWRFGEHGPPWLEDAPANVECVVEQSLAYGSHRALIGRVVAVRIGPLAPSLIYRAGVYS